jgi:hypothetical protein
MSSTELLLDSAICFSVGAEALKRKQMKIADRAFAEHEPGVLRFCFGERVVRS